MNSPFYDEIKTAKDFSTFRFRSVGKREIVKIVVFQETDVEDIYNLALGDWVDNKGFSDSEVSDNGDIRKVLTTVVNIVQVYTKRFPERAVFIKGNTDLRTKAYQRIIRMYYEVFKSDFDMWGYNEVYEKQEFNDKNDYAAFLIKRK